MSTKSNFKIIDGMLSAYRGKSKIAVISDNVKEIGSFTFSKVEFVKEITILESVEIIG